MDTREKILQIIRLKGPVIPSQVNKEIGSNILIASATLGELASNNLVAVSHLKIGGTPLYYLKGQESRLQQFSDKLNEQEKHAYDLLKQKIVLRDRSLTPVTRVALREIKDFAVHLQVNNKGSLESFWKWYLTTNGEAEERIRNVLGAEEKLKEIATEKPKEITQPIPAQPITERLKTEKQEGLEIEKPKIKKAIKKEVKSSDFLNAINTFFHSNNIQVLEQKELRRGSEIEYMLRVPSAVGSLNYFCKAKGKKRISDGDLSSAYIQGQVKKLPVLFLTSGDLTKRANSMLEKEFEGMKVRKI